MGSFTFIPLWVLQDLLILGMGLAAVLFIIKREENARSIILELFAFCFLYAAVYENFATLMGWYGYGRSVLMVFNVPFSIPLVEYLVVYASLRLLAHTRMPAWAKPLVVGLQGMVFDLSLDPVALRQVFDTREGRIGRWTWYPAAGDVQLFGEPVYNYSGWILLCGFAAAAFLLGRRWHSASGRKPWVGLAYPFMAALAALGVLVSPLSRFLLWLWPFGAKGQGVEWFMLAILTAAGLTLLLFYGGRKEGEAKAPGWKDEGLCYLVLIGLPLVNLCLCLAGRQWEVAWLVALAVLAGAAISLRMGRGGKVQAREAKKAGRQ